ncbi:SDR family NAD(P)-dependent oxidoreductase [Marilutibacter spongiae]|uniref:SDR family oxidoreductase n=1 Tax=Marilutibacter spongiae TaxID=2025720 RepID=A0A7W3Y6Y3_9GAMM|nr:SDR family oxidoreductase [Lysobacter spongiae]
MTGTTLAPVLVLGADGGIGRGVVQAVLARRRGVIAVARQADALAELQARAPRGLLTVVAGAVADDREGAALAERLRALDRPLGGMVACLCGHAGPGRLLDQPAEALRRRLDEDLLPHLAAARQLLPLLSERGHNRTYVLIGGPGDERPWAGYGHRSVGAAALRMMARVLHDEARRQDVRVHLLSVSRPVCIDPRQASQHPDWPSARAVGQRALALIDRDCRSSPLPAVVQFAEPALAAALPPEGLTSSSLEVVESTPPAGDAPVATGADATSRMDAGVEPGPPGTSFQSRPANGSVTPGAPAPSTPTTDPDARASRLLTEGCQQAARRLLRGLLPTCASPSSPDKDLPS